MCHDKNSGEYLGDFFPIPGLVVVLIFLLVKSIMQVNLHLSSYIHR